jgi:hypothetical protein
MYSFKLKNILFLIKLKKFIFFLFLLVNLFKKSFLTSYLFFDIQGPITAIRSLTLLPFSFNLIIVL